MAVSVILPKVDMVMEEATFVEWLKAEGDSVKKGEPLFVILTDKASMEIESPGDGILAGVQASADELVPVAKTIAYLLEPGEELPSASVSAPVPVPAPDILPADPIGTTTQPAERIAGEKLRATPVARRLARELGLELESVNGTGPRGRIQKRDVLAAAKSEPSPKPELAFPPVTVAVDLQVTLPNARVARVVPLEGPRKIIAQRMAYSASTTPHITLSLQVDMVEAIRLRDKTSPTIELETGHRLSFTAIIARATAALLPRHPFLNASLADEEIILWDDVNLGIATAVDDYLIVPVIRQAQLMGLAQVVAELADLVERGRARRLTPAEMTGSTFTISNLGMFGIESFEAIINPPEAAILAVGAIVERPGCSGGEMELRPTMRVTLSADHRIIDGVVAARFLADLKATLENPYLMIM